MWYAEAVAGTSLFALIDDIASVLDDVAVMTKVATKKTAGVLGDDLALNAEQVTGVAPDREIPVVLAVAKGSALNKALLVPAALAISALAPWAITPLLMLGGAFLCFEGFEKILHKLLHARDTEADHARQVEALADPKVDMVAFERAKIKGAVRTDFVLSAEIIVIALGTVASMPFGQRVLVLIAVAALMTFGVYGFVAGIVKLDDLGLALSRRPDKGSQRIGAVILRGAPYLMKALSAAGTLAMFLVGGGILVHGISPLHHLEESLAASGGFVGWLLPTLLAAVIGIVGGGIIAGVVIAAKRIKKS